MIEVMPASTEQVPAIARLFREAFRTVLPIVLHTPEEDIAYFRDSVLPANHVMVAVERESGTIAGFIAFSADWVHHLFVGPAYWRRGIGRLLLEQAQKSSSHLRLWTFEVNERARAFYRSQGFVEVASTDGSRNEEREPDVLLKWRAPA